MSQTKSKPIISGFFNYFILTTIVSSCIAFSLTSGIFDIQRIHIAVIFGAYIVLIIFYHSFFAQRVKFITPGEKMAGCIWDDGIKVWTNKFKKNRFLLFVTIFMLLYYPSNIHDDIASGRVVTLISIFVRCLWAFIFLFFVYKIALGKFVWSIGCYIFFIPTIVSLLKYRGEPPIIIEVSIGMIVLTCLFLLASTVFYSSDNFVFLEKYNGK